MKIKIDHTNDRLAVSARDLHEFLEVGPIIGTGFLGCVNTALPRDRISTRSKLTGFRAKVPEAVWGMGALVVGGLFNLMKGF